MGFAALILPGPCTQEWENCSHSRMCLSFLSLDIRLQVLYSYWQPTPYSPHCTSSVNCGLYLRSLPCWWFPLMSVRVTARAHINYIIRCGWAIVTEHSYCKLFIVNCTCDLPFVVCLSVYPYRSLTTKKPPTCLFASWLIMILIPTIAVFWFLNGLQLSNSQVLAAKPACDQNI